MLAAPQSASRGRIDGPRATVLRETGVYSRIDVGIMHAEEGTKRVGHRMFASFEQQGGFTKCNRDSSGARALPPR